MSVKLPKRLSSKKKKPPKDNAQTEVLHKLGLEAFKTAPLDPASMLDISTWTLENQTPLELKDLPNAFLQRLWLLSPNARSTCCKPPSDAVSHANKSPEEMINGFGEESQYAINPLDLVTAVFMSANTFLQQEMAVRMVQCQFAVPLVLPSIDPEEASRFLLWPLRGVVSQWPSHFLGKNRNFQEGDLASTYMPMVSCVKLGHCGISKSQVLNHIISRLKSCNETFLHRGMDGGQLPRRLSNGLVETGWYVPTGDTARDNFSVPVVISNLRGDASTHEKCLSLLCQASSVVIVFCGNLREKEKQLLASCKDMTSKLILIDVSDTEKNENSVVGFVSTNLEEDISLPKGSVLQGKALSEEELANRLFDTLKDLLPNQLKPVTLETAAKLAVELGLNVDEGTVCKKAMVTVEEVLKGLDEGSTQFREKQLPLQGSLWSKLAEIEKEESKQRKDGKEVNPQLQKEELSQWEDSSREHMESWLLRATEKIITTKEKALDATTQNDLLSELKDEAREEVKREVDKIRSNIEAYLMKDDPFKESTETLKPILMSNMGDLQEQVTEEIMQSSACKDFQKLHDRYAKDRELLICITAAKSMYLAEFIYQFRKRDQCQRVAQAFTSMVIKPTLLDYIYRPLGMRIVEEIQATEQQYQSPNTFHQSLLEELIKEDCFETFLEYLLSFDSFRQRKIQETVVAHISQLTYLDKWRQQRLGEIVGKIAAAVSKTAEGTSGVLSDTKPLLERVCLTLERDGDVDVTRAPLDGPLFSITTEWDRFVTCLMELLAAMRLDLAQDFSQNVDITHLLNCFPIPPQHSLFNRVRGCDKQCPLCRAPCEVEEKDHEVHRSLLHRPKGMVPYDSCSLSYNGCPENMIQGNPGQVKDTHISPEDQNSQTPSVYWRYVLARFNEKFANECKKEPAEIPEEWKKITEDEALHSLKEAFLIRQC
ncbi:interferon-induced very large GTPase 1-like protein [Lates japonicus]|uniref:Interferon-induced very large GTPase 1-like protein n=1 Tax=Lates japonicus TaxID=270547 RepID=A0AAD3R668_LATJO|nr:interferon-induced very large GTPase 1-like protein [Lates japonicus]